jgi:hypothetical protein
MTGAEALDLARERLVEALQNNESRVAANYALVVWAIQNGIDK